MKVYRNITFVDQGISALTNYLPLFFSLIVNNWTGVGQATYFSAIYVFIISISRSSLGTFQLVEREKVNLKQITVFGLLTSLSGSFLVYPLMMKLDVNHILVAVILIFPLLQDNLRYASFSSKNPSIALKSDLIWFVTTSMLCLFFLERGFLNFEIILFSWSIGSMLAYCWITFSFLGSERGGITRSKIKIDYSKFLRLGSTGFLSEINTVFVNLIVTALASISLLGEFRFYQILLLPVAFLININKILIIPMLRDQDINYIQKQLKPIIYLRISLYFVAFATVLIVIGKGFQNIISFLLVLIAVESAYRRNLIYQFMIEKDKEKYVVMNLLFYLLFSILIFFVLSLSKVVWVLAFGLALTEQMALFHVKRFKHDSV